MQENYSVTINRHTWPVSEIHCSPSNIFFINKQSDTIGSNINLVPKDKVDIILTNVIISLKIAAAKIDDAQVKEIIENEINSITTQRDELNACT